MARPGAVVPGARRSAQGRLLRGQGPARAGAPLPQGRPVPAREGEARAALDRRRGGRLAAHGDPRRMLVRPRRRADDLRPLAATHMGAVPLLPRLGRGVGWRSLPSWEARHVASAALMASSRDPRCTVSSAVIEQGGESGANGAGTGLPRREFLKRSAAAGGVFAGAWALPVLVREAYGNPVPVPHAARNVEAGLAAFAARWQVAGPAVKLTRFGDFLSDKTFNCRVARTPRSYVLELGTAGATL